jgi:hypothetical protein
VNDTLLFLHVLSAFAFVAGTVMLSSYVLGSPVHRGSLTLANVLFGAGSVGTLVFGVWLALDLDDYEIWDGWIIAALVLWVLANGAGQNADSGIRKAIGDNDAAVSLDRRIVFSHWMRVLWVLLLLIVMVWKPGA